MGGPVLRALTPREVGSAVLRAMPTDVRVAVCEYVRTLGPGELAEMAQFVDTVPPLLFIASAPYADADELHATLRGASCILHSDLMQKWSNAELAKAFTTATGGSSKQMEKFLDRHRTVEEAGVIATIFEVIGALPKAAMASALTPNATMAWRALFIAEAFRQALAAKNDGALTLDAWMDLGDAAARLAQVAQRGVFTAGVKAATMPPSDKALDVLPLLMTISQLLSSAGQHRLGMAEAGDPGEITDPELDALSSSLDDAEDALSTLTTAMAVGDPELGGLGDTLKALAAKVAPLAKLAGTLGVPGASLVGGALDAASKIGGPAAPQPAAAPPPSAQAAKDIIATARNGGLSQPGTSRIDSTALGRALIAASTRT